MNRQELLIEHARRTMTSYNQLAAEKAQLLTAASRIPQIDKEMAALVAEAKDVAARITALDPAAPVTAEDLYKRMGGTPILAPPAVQVPDDFKSVAAPVDSPAAPVRGG